MSNVISIGIGQAGGRICQAITKQSKGNIDAIVINSNPIDLQDITDGNIKKVLMCDENGNSKGLGANPKAGTKFFNFNKEGIRSILADHISKEDVVWVCTALGGGTGSGGVIPLVSLINTFRPSIINVIAILSSERDGINKYLNSTQQAYNLFDKCCVKSQKANLILIDNGMFESIESTNESLLSKIYPLIAGYEDLEPTENSIGHADIADLETALKTKCGCIMIHEENELDNKFMGHTYEMSPVSIWIRDISDGANRDKILDFLDKQKKGAGIYHGEYKQTGPFPCVQTVITGLGLPPTILQNRKKLMSNMNNYNERKTGEKKTKTMDKLKLGKEIKL